MSDDDSQTARGDAPDSVTFVGSEGAVTSNVEGVHFVGITGSREASAPIRLSIPGELHFEILGTPTSEQLEEYARLIQSLIVVAQLAAEQRSET